MKKECTICVEKNIRFHTCNTCTNDVCGDCYTKVRRCPFCRSKYPHKQEEEKNDPELDNPNEDPISVIVLLVILGVRRRIEGLENP
jgi:hypothetical protein